VLWLGFGPSSKIAVVIAMVFFPNFFNIYHGLKSVSMDLVSRTRTLGASRLDLIKNVYLPSVAVWALASLRASVGFAFLAAVVAEYIGASVGVGYLIGLAAQVGSVTQIFAGICVIMIMVLPLNFVVSLIESRLERWRPAPAARP
jgi:NitT/TauT family transport system permease protein